MPTDSELAAVSKGGELALPGLLRGLITGDGFDMFVANGADEVLLMTVFQNGNIESEGLQILNRSSQAKMYPEAMKMRWDFGRKYGGKESDDTPKDWDFERQGSHSLVLQAFRSIQICYQQ